MQIKYKKISFFVIGVSVFSVFIFYTVDYFNKKNEILSSKNKDVVKFIRENNQEAKNIQQAASVKDYEKALDTALQMLQNAKSSEEKAFAEFSVADTYMILKKQDEATKTFVSIFNNSSYDKYTRVAAMNNVMQQYAGSADRQYLDLVFPETKGFSPYDLKLHIYKKMYEVQPTTQSIFFVGADTFKKLDKTKKLEAETLFKNYIKEMDYDIEIQARGVGSNHLVPNLIMSKASLSTIALDKFNLSSVEEISYLYEQSVKKATEKLNPITEQFALLSYANFLANHKQIDKAVTIFNIFAAKKTTEMVDKNLKSSTLEKGWPGIYILYTKDKSIKSYLDSKNVQPK